MLYKKDYNNNLIPNNSNMINIICDLSNSKCDHSKIIGQIEKINKSYIIKDIILTIDDDEQYIKVVKKLSKIENYCANLTIYMTYDLFKKKVIGNVLNCNIIVYVNSLSEIEDYIMNYKDNFHVIFYPVFNKDIDKVCIRLVNENLKFIFNPFMVLSEKYLSINQEIDYNEVIDKYLKILLYISKYSIKYNNYSQVINWASIYPNIDCGYNSEYLYVNSYGEIKLCPYTCKCDFSECSKCEYRYICNMKCINKKNFDKIKEFYKKMLLLLENDDMPLDKYNKLKG